MGPAGRKSSWANAGWLALGSATDARALNQSSDHEAALSPPEADRSAEEDGDGARRDLELFWLRLNAGYTALDLTTFQADGDNLTADLIPSRIAGPTVGLGVGVRLLFISLAARGSVAFFTDADVDRRVGDMQLWSLDGDVFFSEDEGEHWTTIATSLPPISKGGHFRNLAVGASAH